MAKRKFLTKAERVQRGYRITDDLAFYWLIDWCNDNTIGLVTYQKISTSLINAFDWRSTGDADIWQTLYDRLLVAGPDREEAAKELKELIGEFFFKDFIDFEKECEDKNEDDFI